MSRLNNIGFESRSNILEGFSSPAAFSFATNIVRSGNVSGKFSSGAGNTSGQIVTTTTIVLGTYYYWRAYIYFDTNFPTADITVVCSQDNTLPFAPIFEARFVAASSKLRLLGGGVQIGSDSSKTLLVNTWYRVELMTKLGTGALDETELRLDGDTIASSTGLNITDVTTVNFGCGFRAAPGANRIMYVDDCALNDSNGVNQNSWPGSGKEVLLIPTATNGSPAAKWTDNDGTQTNMWEGVNNTPPTGTAATTTPSHLYIKHGGGAAGTTDEFDVTMTTYSAAGISATDTINLIEYIVATGEEAATGTKLLALKGVSNPIVAQGNNFDVFPTSGAQGTYPTNWQLKHDGLSTQYSPSVTIASAPVFGVVRPETATRVASVCAMFMYVDYTPSSAPIPGSESDAIPAKSSQIVSVNRASFY